MPLRLIQFVLDRFGWDRDTLPTVKVLPPRSIPIPQAEDGVCHIQDSTVIRPDEPYCILFEAVKGQRIVIEVDFEGVAAIHVFAGDEDDESGELLESWDATTHQPCRAFFDTSVSRIYTLAAENLDDKPAAMRVRIWCEAARNATPRKGPKSESAAAGTDGLGNGRAKHGNRDGQQGSLIGSSDPAEPSGVFVPREQTDGQAHHRDGTGQQSDDDVEPPV